MKRALLSLAIVSTSFTAYAEDHVVLWGNYYKERSTRVIEPTIAVSKDLPFDAQIEVGYLVDQITSASGAFTTTDRPFSELRHDVRVGYKQRFLGMFRPGVRVRYSHEPDYDSLSLGLDMELTFDRDNTVIRASYQHQFDEVRMRRNFGEIAESFEKIGELDTDFVSLSLTQVIAKNLVAGAGVDMALLDGFMENVYRVETHPTERSRYSGTLWAAYHVEPWDTTGRLGYRFYADSWELVGHTIDLEVTQRVAPPFELVGRFRYYTQSSVYFTVPQASFQTTDPKLYAFDSRFFEIGFRWQLTFLHGSPLEVFSGSRIEPSYGYLDQDNRYGGAHLAQLGWYWPF